MGIIQIGGTKYNNEEEEEVLPSAKRPRLTSAGGANDNHEHDFEAVRQDEGEGRPSVKSKPSTSIENSGDDHYPFPSPYFHLTKVFGLSDEHNGGAVALGIKGSLFNLNMYR